MANRWLKQAAAMLPVYVGLVAISTAAVAADRPQQEVDNPMQQEVFTAEAELPPEVIFSEWQLPEGEEEPALSINEPMYFVVGSNADGSGDLKARFQISFKYRMFSEEGWFTQKLPWLDLEHFHLGYTQTSLWNLSAESKPFEDTSYRPTFFWEYQTPQYSLLPDYWRFGYEHESNGQAGVASRSIDSLFIQPAWAWRWADETILVAPRLSAYVNKGTENEDIIDYRGAAEVTVRYGSEDSFLASLNTRYGLANKGSLQLDLSYPIRQKIFSRAGGYVYLQLFHGYGESLLTYDQKEDLRIRIGFAIVR